MSFFLAYSLKVHCIRHREIKSVSRASQHCEAKALGSRKLTAAPIFSTSTAIFLLLRKNKVWGGKIHGEDDVRQKAHFDREWLVRSRLKFQATYRMKQWRSVRSKTSKLKRFYKSMSCRGICSSPFDDSSPLLGHALVPGRSATVIGESSSDSTRCM
jgi:hypothetical protein